MLLEQDLSGVEYSSSTEIEPTHNIAAWQSLLARDLLHLMLKSSVFQLQICDWKRDLMLILDVQWGLKIHFAEFRVPFRRKLRSQVSMRSLFLVLRRSTCTAIRFTGPPVHWIPNVYVNKTVISWLRIQEDKKLSSPGTWTGPIWSWPACCVGCPKIEEPLDCPKILPPNNPPDAGVPNKLPPLDCPNIEGEDWPKSPPAGVLFPPNRLLPVEALFCDLLQSQCKKLYSIYTLNGGRTAQQYTLISVRHTPHCWYSAVLMCWTLCRRILL